MSKLSQANRNAKTNLEVTTVAHNPWRIQRKTQPKNQTDHSQAAPPTSQSTTPSRSNQNIKTTTQSRQHSQPCQQQLQDITRVRIIGIDPGSRQTGCAIIELQQNQPHLLHCSTLQAKQACFNQRIVSLHQQLQVIIETFQPTEAAVESVFVKLNPQSAIKLGQARGVLLLALAQQHIPIHEYAPRLVKQACCGYGAATKAQIQTIVQQLFKLSKLPASDAADAAAIALCHSQQRRWQQACQLAQQNLS